MEQISPPALGDDILDGADAIAEFVFGSSRHRRRVYHLVERGALPVFRLGTKLCARRSVLTEHIRAQETASINDGRAS